MYRYFLFTSKNFIFFKNWNVWKKILNVRKRLIKQLKEETFPSCLLNKSLKKKRKKKSNIALGKGPVCQLKYVLWLVQHIPPKCVCFISRHFLDMMHSRLNSQTVATLLIVAHRRLLFDKFREVSSLYKNSMVF